ncbi:tyrosine-type recombinase/integrase [Amycolatopsis sp. NPDC051128]|uniref:tyrosine-type recombinase/integrase n=1 Tax=Amycolatopsis sp. NPDC051128 TaxID=3155412 RepID=UPI00343C622C
MEVTSPTLYTPTRGKADTLRLRSEHRRDRRQFAPNNSPMATAVIICFRRRRERAFTRCSPMPFLFQRRFGTEDRPLTRSYIRECLVAMSQAAEITAGGQALKWRHHDFRRIFVTDAIRSGLPPHIAARVCGHSTVDTTVRTASPAGAPPGGTGRPTRTASRW